MAANLPTHPSLPARPPPSSYAAPPVHHNGAAGARPFAGFTPRSVSAQIAPPVTAAPSVYPQANVSTAPSPYASSGTYYDNSYAAYGTATPTAAYPANPPMSRGYGAGSYDAEEEARIAEWSNAYAQDANGKKGANAAGAAGANRPEAASTPDSEAGTKTGKQKTVVREAGGKSWEDPSLLEWDPMHPRLFIGNLAGEVTDDSLLKAFSKYPSVSKARVVRDKRTTKSKSYGFVSFADTDDYFKAAKEMQGCHQEGRKAQARQEEPEQAEPEHLRIRCRCSSRRGRHQPHARSSRWRTEEEGQASRSPLPWLIGFPPLFDQPHPHQCILSIVLLTL
ncbi:hypothetical protein BS50DRAFT_75805 [Corynespora cassiicola Philippines]|uniref:RRM domain-containing protein n=1 Tax=Corynespora cassiicola Philippines TaxID=1448308 RepID=A0A2T2NHJ7_CORCC|nr:hypothetical protein BS50DRAFT_75805 [Corynespora cassiicola Philippines]